MFDLQARFAGPFLFRTVGVEMRADGSVDIAEFLALPEMRLLRADEETKPFCGRKLTPTPPG